jgi:hypothetical protein
MTVGGQAKEVIGAGSMRRLPTWLEMPARCARTRQSSWQRRRARPVAGGVCPRGGARGGGRSPAGCPREGPRLGDSARGRVEEEDGREAAHYPAGGAVARLVDGR